MGKTVPSYRMALESEIYLWKALGDSLMGDEDKQAFDEVMDLCRRNAMAGGNACNPIVFETMVMSVLLGQQKEIRRLKHKLQIS
jgi:hypothetical protein